MIEKTLVFLKEEINKYLTLRTGFEDKISIASLLDKDGKLQVTDVTLTLVKIEEEKLLKNQTHYKETPQGTIAKVNPEMMVNLYVLFTSNFGDDELSYRESLKFISHIISFFQARNVFTPNQYPGLDSRVEKLVTELFTLSFEQMNNIWGSLGANYLTSVMYKIRLLAIQEDEFKMDAPPIVEGNLNA